MSSLAALQRGFQQYVLRGDADTASQYATGRVEVYRHAYTVRLTDALAANFPRLQQWLAADAFSELASRYIERHPSTFTSIRWFGDQLAAFLCAEQPLAPWLSDLARWEWQIANAFDAADGDPIDTTMLATVAPDTWPHLAFGMHPSIGRLTLHTNAVEIYASLSRESATPEARVLDAPEHWFVCRRGNDTKYSSLGGDEADAIDCALAGGTFAAICATLADRVAEEDVPLAAATMLKRWIADELIVGLRVTPA